MVDQRPFVAQQPPRPWWHLAPWPIHTVQDDGTPKAPNQELAAALGLDHSTSSGEHGLLALVPASTRRLLRQAIHEPSPPSAYRELALGYRHRNGTPMMAHAARVGPLNGDHPPLVMLQGLEPRPPIERAALQARLGALVAHDLNNVFTVARSFIDLILRRRIPLERTTPFLERSVGALNHGIRLNAILQTFSHPEVLGPLETCDLHALIEEMRPFIGRLLQPGPAWQIDVAPALSPIEARKAGLQRLLLDLCVNAYRAWPRVSTLCLELRPTPGNANHLLIKAYPLTHTPPEGLTPRFDALFCRHQVSPNERRDPLFIDGILPHRQVAIDLSAHALSAWLHTDPPGEAVPH